VIDDPLAVVEWTGDGTAPSRPIGIVVGCGSFGAAVSAGLAKRGYSVVLVDRDEAAFRRLPMDLPVRRVVGDGSDSRILRSAGLDRATGIFVTTGDESLNLAVAEIARAGSGVPRVLMRATDPVIRQLGTGVGARTIDPVALATEAFLIAFEEGARGRAVRTA
jgi:trk system potassium uptake protein TrkA